MSIPLISVIVPVYNVEHYLEPCVNSILKQTYTNIEIILINDGSVDKSGEICDYFGNNFNNVYVIHKSNGGVASVRNLGIQKSKGEYISFIDSDDLVPPDFLEHLFSLSDDSDVVICDYIEFDDEKEINNSILHNNNVERLTGEEMLGNLNNPKYNRLTVVPWNKLYKKKVFKNILYPEGKVHEDEFVIHHIYNNCNFISLSKEQKYFYRKGHISITADRPIKSIYDAIYAFDDRIRFFKNKNKYKLVQQAYDARMAMLLYNSVDDNIEEWRNYSVCNFVFSKINWKIKTQLIIKKISPKIYTKYRQQRGFK